MRAHAKAIRNGLEVFPLFVNAVLTSPPPCLMYKWPVRRIHQADDPMIDGARQASAQIRGFEFVTKCRNRRCCRGRVLASCESRTSRSGIRNEYPYKSVALFTRKTARINPVHFYVLICGQRRNQSALPAEGIEFPTMITALNLFAVEPAARQRHTAMRAGVAQCKSSSVPIAAKYKRNFKQHGLLQLAMFDLL